MRVEMLYIDHCPSWQAAGARLEEALTTLGIEAQVGYRLLSSAADTVDVPFGGSPTILVDGADLFPGAECSRELACRVYPTPEGLRALPTTAQLVEALRQLG